MKIKSIIFIFSTIIVMIPSFACALVSVAIYEDDAELSQFYTEQAVIEVDVVNRQFFGFSFARTDVTLSYDFDEENQQQHSSWFSGAPTTFNLQYETTLNGNALTFSVGIHSQTIFVDAITDVFIMAKSESYQSSIDIGDIEVNGQAVAEHVHASANSTSDILHISSVYFQEGFDFHAQSNMLWPGNQLFGNSKLSFTIHVASVDNTQYAWENAEGTPSGVPEPHSITLLTVALLGIIKKLNNVLIRK